MFDNACIWSAITILIALGSVLFDHWLSRRERRRDLVHSLLIEIRANKEYLGRSKYATLYDDAYSIAKNSGSLGLDLYKVWFTIWM
jgi:hypothetical protein